MEAAFNRLSGLSVKIGRSFWAFELREKVFLPFLRVKIKLTIPRTTTTTEFKNETTISD